MNEKNTALSMSHLMHEKRKFAPPSDFSQKSHIQTTAQYEKEYRDSLNDDAYWLRQADSLTWFKKPTKALEYCWDTPSKRVEHTWFEDGTINVSYNCLDRHLDTLKHKTAILWQGESDAEVRSLSYEDLHKEVCQFANVLKAYGVKKGDRVCIYMPMIPELAVAMLSCARIGAIHSIVFGGFSAESIAHRIQDSDCILLVTANVSIRAGIKIHLKEIVNTALTQCPTIQHVITVKRNDDPCIMLAGRDVWYHEAMQEKGLSECPAEPLSAEDPLFILYTSGSTGKPKGVVHTQAGYLLQATMTHRYIFDVRQEDVYWCTADLGWITGHTYGIYGPLANGTTTLMFEGVPTYPDPGRFWQVVEKHRVSIFYTAPTVIRSLIRHGETYPNQYDLSSLRLLGTVGEPINPEAWVWYHEIIGKGKCPIVDTWWQTETGGIMLAAMPGCHAIKPGSASQPFFGVEPVILRDDSTVCDAEEGGNLCINKPWPGIMRTMWRDHERFINTYFSQFKNRYFTGDGCLVDEEGDYWLLGRIDDVVNVSGHRIGTAEVESALVSHESVAEAAVVPMPHEIKGQGLCAYIILMESCTETPDLIKQLGLHVRKEIGAIAVPDKIKIAKALPKTRSGKIMRRVLRKIASNELDQLGDISTMIDPNVINELID